MALQEKPKNNVGFTLLELIISITLVAIIVLIVAGAANLGYRSFNSGERKLNAVERLRASLIIIDAQIQSGVPLTLE
ncbi:MAG: type II secretion system protein J, partial [Syntrophorhabdus sp.]